MLFSRFISFIVTLFKLSKKEFKTTEVEQKIDMCNKTSSSAKTSYLFHENYDRYAHYDCMCHLNSSSKLTITIQRQFVLPFTNSSSYSKLTMKTFQPGNVSSVNMITDIYPFGSNCLFGEDSKCIFSTRSTKAEIQLNESESFSRYIFRIKAGSEYDEVNIKCDRRTLVLHKPMDANESQVFIDTTPETMLYVGIIFFVFAFVMAAAIITMTVLRKYRNNPEFRRILSLKLFNEDQPKENVNNTQLKAPVDNYEEVSTGIPATQEATENYEFCEIVDAQVEQESTAPPQIPTTPLPNQQIKSLHIAYLEKQSTIEEEEAKQDNDRYSRLPSETPQNVNLSKDENGEDTYDHIPNTDCSAFLTSLCLNEESHSVKSLETSSKDLLNFERRSPNPRKNTSSSQTRRLNSDGWYLENVNTYKGKDELVKGASLPNYQRSKSAANIQDDININFAEVVAELKSYVNVGDIMESGDQNTGDYFIVLENELYQSLDD